MVVMALDLWPDGMLAKKWWTGLLHPSNHKSQLLRVYKRIQALHTYNHSHHACGTSDAIAADPLATPASVKVVRLSGEVTVRSKAAGLPIIQFCTRISAGLLCLLSAPKPQSPRHAQWQNCEKASVKLLWRRTTSPPPLHVTAWCPRGSSW